MSLTENWDISLRIYYIFFFFLLHTDILSSASSNGLVGAYFQRLIYIDFFVLSSSHNEPFDAPNRKVRPLSQARVPDGADKPVTQVTATPLPAVCGDPRGSRPRRAHSSCDWTAGRASDSPYGAPGRQSSAQL